MKYTKLIIKELEKLAMITRSHYNIYGNLIKPDIRVSCGFSYNYKD